MFRHHAPWLSIVLIGLTAIFILGCGDDATTPNMGTVSLAFAVPAASGQRTAGGAVPVNAQAFTDGAGNALVVETAELVAREIEFERTDSTADCDDDSGGDDCDEIETGPVLVTLPLDGTVSTTVTAQVLEGSYDEVEIDIHKPSDDDASDASFIAAHPDFADISIRVTGTYNESSFTFTTDLDEEQEIELASPIRVNAGGAEVNVTLTIDLDTWFRSGDQTLVDPTTANKGGLNEELVANNIRASIHGFEDDDHDGEADD